ncbi:MAG TPA: hypothetical protein VK604_09390 [Bryobacteraceae bacterium]|nr:hypothetical protein [Bryobacteraceae bacterium]
MSLRSLAAVAALFMSAASASADHVRRTAWSVPALSAHLVYFTDDSVYSLDGSASWPGGQTVNVMHDDFMNRNVNAAPAGLAAGLSPAWLVISGLSVGALLWLRWRIAKN